VKTPVFLKPSFFKGCILIVQDSLSRHSQSQVIIPQPELIPGYYLGRSKPSRSIGISYLCRCREGKQGKQDE
jgi:hypothetical protein